MEINNTPIPGLYIVDANLFNDLRGELIKPFNRTVYASKDINLNIKEVWFTKSKENVIRAMHLQLGEKACEKIVSVIHGKVLDVILDVRVDSPTFGKVFEIELSSKNPKALYIPIGCAHGYKVIEPNSVVMYMGTEEHDPKGDIGIRWDSFGYDWKVANPVLSDRDCQLDRFEDFVEKIKADRK